MGGRRALGECLWLGGGGGLFFFFRGRNSHQAFIRGRHDESVYSPAARGLLAKDENAGRATMGVKMLGMCATCKRSQPRLGHTSTCWEASRDGEIDIPEHK